MAYKRTTWVDGSTPLDAANMNNIETGIAEAKSDIVTLDTKKLNSSELPTAVQDALATAKESGEFDGEQGKDGIYYTPSLDENGRLSFTPSDLAGEDDDRIITFMDSLKGSNGFSPTVSVAQTATGATITITDKSGPKTATISNGKDGENGDPGKDGTSVTVSNVSESTVDGGNNVVTFSDGKTLTVKNGSKGSTGPAGVNGSPGADGYTPIKGVDYYTEADKAEFSEYIASELAKRGQLKPEFANDISECTDTSKLYVLPDGYIYGYILTDTAPEPLYTNLLPEAINENGTGYVGANGEDGYKTGYRISGSSGTSGGVAGGGEKAATGYDVTGFIPVKSGQTVRFKNVDAATIANTSRYCTSYFYTSSFVKTSDVTYFDVLSPVDGVYTFTAPTNTNIAYMRLTLGGVSANTIITVNQEIKMSEGGKGYAWASTGHAFVPADYEDRIVDLEADVAKHEGQLVSIESKIENIGGDASEEAAYNRIKNWEYPIFEDAPVFLLETNKPAIASYEMTTAAIYAKYDALMVANSHYITRVNCGMASDGTTPIYAYHFKEPNPHYLYTGAGQWTEMKPAFLVCSGVHPMEQAGVHSLFNAMEEITTNPKLLDLRRNLHFIIFPMLNPTAFSDTTYYMRNPDGIQVHHNFELGHGENGAVQGDRYYGGATPLSIPETQYFDAVMNEYKDRLVLVMSCHNNTIDERHGTGVIWSSCATQFTCNLGFRFADKMSAAWREKHGADVFDAGIRWANDFVLAQYENPTISDFNWLFDNITPEEQPDWDHLIGRANMSSSGGTEYRQALKYGIHGVNVEVCPRCMILDRDYNLVNSSNALTMGTETYINYFRTYMAVYDIKNKKDYAPNLPWKAST